MKLHIQKRQQGVAISSQVAASLQEIVGRARRVDELVAQIAAASPDDPWSALPFLP